MNKLLRMMTAVAFTALLAVSLTACLVKKETPKPATDRGGDNLHIYKDGDRIFYQVTSLVAGTDTPVTGTLKIHWTGPIFKTSPDKTMSSIPVMKKVITLQIDGNGSEYPKETVHYVYQDDDPASSSYGTEYLVAMESPDKVTDYWLNSVGGSNFAPAAPGSVIGGQEAIVTQESPLYLNQSYTVEYNLMNECDLTVSCQGDVGASTNTITVVSDDTPIHTQLGTNYANPFKIAFEGGVTPTGGNTSLPLLLNILDACSAETSTHSGTMYVVPDIGVIQLDNTCISSGTTGQITSTSIFIYSYFFSN